MYAIRSKRAAGQEDEREFTLPELPTTIALLEHWRVNAVTRQLVGDLRHSQASATATQVALRNRMR